MFQVLCQWFWLCVFAYGFLKTLRDDFHEKDRTKSRLGIAMTLFAFGVTGFLLWGAGMFTRIFP